MLRIDGRPRVGCDGLSRRTLLQAAGAGLFGLTLPRVLGAEARASTGTSAGRGRAKSVIFVFLFGGPSQLETFDLKPDAPEKIRGPFRPIASRTPGLRISEKLPLLAAQSDRFCVVRTMSHPFNDHSGAAHYLQTGKVWHIPIGGGFTPTQRDWPSMGSVVEYVSQNEPNGSQLTLPSYAVLPNSLGRLQEMGQYPRPGEHAGWLGRKYNPLTTVVDKKDLKDNPYWRDCADEELTFTPEGLTVRGLEPQRMRNRVSLLERFDEARRRMDRVAQARGKAFDSHRRRALSLATSDATRRALDIRSEDPRTRDRYGRNLFGQSALMARRLVEAGVRFVTVHYDACDGYGWDSHIHSDDVSNHLMPTFDCGMSALLDDLNQTGLLDETLVIALGEMGRTPQASDRWGRGHWSTLFPALLAGAGIRGGSTYGSSDRNAGYAVDRPVSPERLAATVYHALGIDPELRVPDPQNRPVPVIVDGAEPVTDLFG